MNASVTASEMLKFVTWVRSSLQAMNSSMSGWSTRRMPMLAPRRVPPCFTTSVDASYSFMNDTGPEATPMVERTTRSEEHTSELQSQSNLVCRLLLEKKKTTQPIDEAGHRGTMWSEGLARPD